MTLSNTGGEDCENTSRSVRDRRDELILSLAGAASVQQTVDATTVDTCPAFFAGGCEIAVAPCGPPTMKAKCIGKTCGPDNGP